MPHWIGKKEIRTMTDQPRDFQPEGRKCEFCDYFFEEDRIHKTVDNDDICEHCMEDYGFVRCGNCGAVFEKEELMTCVECGHQLKEKEKDD